MLDTDYVIQTSWVDFRSVDPAEKALCYFFAKMEGHNPESLDRDGPAWTMYRPQAQTALRELRSQGVAV